MLDSTGSALCSPGVPVSEAVRARLVERIEAKTLELPILPAIAAEVMRATSDESADARRLAELIRRDQSMAAHLLRIANSPVYAGAMRLTSLQQACSRLGMDAIRNIAMVISCQTRVFRAPGYETDVRDLFQHSLAAALFAQEIARIRRWNVEEAFLAGLLHDLGRPTLIQAILDIAKELHEIAARAGVLEIVDAHHARVGSMMATSWNLPERAALAILHHHDADPPAEIAQAAFVTSLADELAHLTVGPRALYTLSYPYVELVSGRQFPVHQLVAEAFLGKRQKGIVVRHLDDDPFHIHRDNLRYGTRGENRDDRGRRELPPCRQCERTDEKHYRNPCSFCDEADGPMVGQLLVAIPPPMGGFEPTPAFACSPKCKDEFLRQRRRGDEAQEAWRREADEGAAESMSKIMGD